MSPCVLTVKTRILCVYESLSKLSLWPWILLSSFILKKNWGQLLPLSLMSCVGCATLLGKDMHHIIFPAMCMDLKATGRPKEKELAGGHMTVMNSRTKGLFSAFSHRIPPEPWRWGSENGPGFLRRDTSIVHFYLLNRFTKTHFLFLLSSQIFPRISCSWRGGMWLSSSQWNMGWCDLHRS